MKMTWDNGRHGKDNVKERLDRFIATVDWLDMYPLARVKNLPRVASDHSPILLCCEEHQRKIKKVKPFRFEKMWLRAAEFSSVVEEAWIDGVMAGFGNNPVSLLKVVLDRLQSWNYHDFGHIQRQIREKSKQLEYLQCHDKSQNSEIQHKVRNEIKELLCMEEVM